MRLYPGCFLLPPLQAGVMGPQCVTPAYTHRLTPRPIGSDGLDAGGLRLETCISTPPLSTSAPPSATLPRSSNPALHKETGMTTRPPEGSVPCERGGCGDPPRGT